MALRDLLDALEEEGAAEHARADQDRRREAAQILAEARERGARTRAAALVAAETDAQQEAQDLVVAARFGARRAVRTARDDALVVVMERVHERLTELPGTNVGAAAARDCVDEALRALPHALTVRVHPADVASLRSPLPVKLVPDLETGGATAEDDEGRYVDNTLLTRLANSWPELRVGLARSWDQDS